MALKHFNSATLPSISSRGTAPIISLNMKAGLFGINKAACELLGLKNGDYIGFAQDDEDEVKWYVYKSDKTGFQVREKNNVTSGVLFNNSRMGKLIAASVAFEGKGGKMLVEDKPFTIQGLKNKYYPLNMSGLRNK